MDLNELALQTGQILVCFFAVQARIEQLLLSKVFCRGESISFNIVLFD